MKKAILALIIIGFQQVISQDGSRRAATSTSEIKKDGYSIVLTNTKVQVSIDEEDLQMIDQKRSLYDTVIYHVNPFAYIKIFPKSEIKE